MHLSALRAAGRASGRSGSFLLGYGSVTVPVHVTARCMGLTEARWRGNLMPPGGSVESESAPAGSAADSDGPGPAQRPSELVGFKVRSHGHGLMNANPGRQTEIGPDDNWNPGGTSQTRKSPIPVQGTEPPIPIPTAIPDLPGIGDGGPIPDLPGIGGPSPPPSPICQNRGYS